MYVLWRYDQNEHEMFYKKYNNLLCSIIFIRPSVCCYDSYSPPPLHFILNLYICALVALMNRRVYWLCSSSPFSSIFLVSTKLISINSRILRHLLSRAWHNFFRYREKTTHLYSVTCPHSLRLYFCIQLKYKSQNTLCLPVIQVNWILTSGFSMFQFFPHLFTSISHHLNVKILMKICWEDSLFVLNLKFIKCLWIFILFFRVDKLFMVHIA